MIKATKEAIKQILHKEYIDDTGGNFRKQLEEICVRLELTEAQRQRARCELDDWLLDTMTNVAEQKES